MAAVAGFYVGYFTDVVGTVLLTRAQRRKGTEHANIKLPGGLAAAMHLGEHHVQNFIHQS